MTKLFKVKKKVQRVYIRAKAKQKRRPKR